MMKVRKTDLPEQQTLAGISFLEPNARLLQTGRLQERHRQPRAVSVR